MAKKEGSTAVDSVFKIIKDNGVKMVDLKFVDFPGQWQHFTVPVTELSEDIFEVGLGFDGSSIRGWKQIHESDMLIVPDPATVIIDPFCDIPTLSLVCNVFDPLTKQKYRPRPA